MEQGINEKELANILASAGIRVEDRALPLLATYLAMLAQWNRAMNLVGAKSWQDILGKLVVDSFFLADFLRKLPLPPEPLAWDLGSGAGLPGIPLRMVWQHGKYYMVEAREKRALFLSNALASLELPMTHVFRGTVEHFFPGQYCQADLIVSRAFLPWPKLLELTLPHLRQQGFLIVLANRPEPDSLPGSWLLHNVHNYKVAGRDRWFWALGPASLSGQAGDAHCPGRGCQEKDATGKGENGLTKPAASEKD